MQRVITQFTNLIIFSEIALFFKTCIKTNSKIK